MINLSINEEIVLDPQEKLGISSLICYFLEGIPRRELRVGLGIPAWGEGFLYPRCAVNEFAASLRSIDPALVPDKNDILLGFIDPISF